MTVVEEQAGKVIGTPMLRREDPALLTGEAKFTNDLHIPGALHLAVLRSPYAHARITSVDVSGAAEPARRRGRLFRGRPAGPVGRADALRLARHAGHEEPPSLPGSGVEGLLRGRRGGRGAGHQRGGGAGRVGRHRRPVRAAAGRDRPRGLTQRPRRHPRLRGHEQELHVGAQDRRGRRRRRVRQRRPLRQEALHPAASHPHGDGATGGGRHPTAVRRRDDALLGHPDPPHPEDHDRADPRPVRAPGPGRGAQRRWRVRLEAQRLRRGAALCGAGPQARRAGALERGAQRGFPGHDPGPRPDPGHRAGRRRERQAHRRCASA